LNLQSLALAMLLFSVGTVGPISAVSDPQAQTHYEVLGLKQNAEPTEIKMAFKNLASVHHPDRHQNVSNDERNMHEEKFKKIASAYEVLSDPNKRRAYDKGLSSATFGARSPFAAEAENHGRYRDPFETPGAESIPLESVLADLESEEETRNIAGLKAVISKSGEIAAKDIRANNGFYRDRTLTALEGVAKRFTSEEVFRHLALAAMALPYVWDRNGFTDNHLIILGNRMGWLDYVLEASFETYVVEPAILRALGNGLKPETILEVLSDVQFKFKDFPDWLLDEFNKRGVLADGDLLLSLMDRLLGMSAPDFRNASISDHTHLRYLDKILSGSESWSVEKGLGVFSRFKGMGEESLVALDKFLLIYREASAGEVLKFFERPIRTLEQRSRFYGATQQSRQKAAQNLSRYRQKMKGYLGEFLGKNPNPKVLRDYLFLAAVPNWEYQLESLLLRFLKPNRSNSKTFSAAELAVTVRAEKTPADFLKEVPSLIERFKRNPHDLDGLKVALKNLGGESMDLVRARFLLFQVVFIEGRRRNTSAAGSWSAGWPSEKIEVLRAVDIAPAHLLERLSPEQGAEVNTLFQEFQNFCLKYVPELTAHSLNPFEAREMAMLTGIPAAVLSKPWLPANVIVQTSKILNRCQLF